jgi:hypothetical protein
MRTPIQKAIAQNMPFGSPAHEAAVGLILVADILRRRLGKAVEPFGITGQQYNVLRILRGGRKEGVPESMDDTIREVDRSSVGRLRPAEQKDLVRLLGRIVAAHGEP